MNGSLGTVTSVNPKALTINLDDRSGGDSKEVVVDFDLYNHVDHGYAATIHKAQGITVDRAYLLASKYLDSHATYVGMSRHRESVDLFYSKEEFPKYTDLVNNLARDRAKDVSVDYVEKNSLAVNYGIEPIKEPEKVKDPGLQIPLVNKGFPFKNQFSNLEGFKTLEQRDQDFNALRKELAQKFGIQQDQTPLDQQIFKLKGFGAIETKDHETTKQMEQFEQMFSNSNRFVKDQDRLHSIMEIPDLNKTLKLDLESKVGLKRNINVIEPKQEVVKVNSSVVEKTQQQTKQQIDALAKTKEIVKDWGLER
jgi:hypothetical protein